jgi:dTDP-4-dehydrorhamnose reductase
MKKIALIGANGQLGTDIYKVFSSDDYYKIFPLTTREIDVTDPNLTKKVLEEIKPHIVVNTAAYHRVDEVEDNPEKAFLVNATAEKNLAELCQSHKWSLVFISTDYVYGLDKKRNKPYIETDTPGPINVYGVSKLAGEYLTRFICQRHFVIRLCGLFGIVGALGKGGNFVETMIRLGKEKGKVKVVDDQVLTPTYTKNIAENLRELLKTDYYGLYHMTSEGQCSWWEFACEIFKLLKMKIKCSPVTSDVFKTRAKRPFFSVLENYNLKKIKLNKMRGWKKNLKLYLREKGYL